MALSREQSLAMYGTPAYTGWGETEAMYDAREHGARKKAEYESSLNQPSGGGGTSTGDLLKKQQEAAQQKQTEFLGRYTGAVEGLEPLTEIRNRLSSELGLDETRYAAKQLSDVVSRIPETEETIGKQVGISAPRLARRIEQRTSDVLPDFQKAIQNQAFLESIFGEQLGLEFQQRQETLLPYELEAGMISDYLKGQVTLYNTQIAGQLQNELQRIVNQGLRDVQELKNVAEMAKIENDYFDSSWIDSEGQKKLVNNRTGEVIATLPGALRNTTPSTPFQSNPPNRGSAWVSEEDNVRGTDLQTLDALIFG